MCQRPASVIHTRGKKIAPVPSYFCTSLPFAGRRTLHSQAFECFDGCTTNTCTASSFCDWFVKAYSGIYPRHITVTQLVVCGQRDPLIAPAAAVAHTHKSDSFITHSEQNFFCVCELCYAGSNPLEYSIQRATISCFFFQNVFWWVDANSGF